MAAPLETSLSRGDAALKAGQWQAAHDAFSEALREGEIPEAFFGLGTARFWLGDLRGTLSAVERAYAGFRARGEPIWAAACALRLAFHQRQHMANSAAASGWLSRACRLFEDHDLTPLEGELLLMKAYLSEDLVAGEAFARAALGLGRERADIDLELSALVQLGAVLVDQGRIPEGLALLDEAMAACVGGETKNPDTIVFTHCMTMTSCSRCADFQRAVQWVRAAEAAADRLQFPFFYVECRVHHARIMLATGDWTRAEELASSALALSNGVTAYRAEALATLAELRLAQGRLEEAERLLDGVEGQPAAIPVLARVRLRRGDAGVAAAIAERRLDVLGDLRLESAALVEVLGDAEIELGARDRAAARGKTLADLGARVDCSIMKARGERLQGSAIAGADPHAARCLLDRALEIFVRLEMPYEAARTRLALARTLADVDPGLAAEEARTALAAFERQGASDADIAAAFLRERGVRAGRAGPRRLAALTKRETEVLALLGEGLSNPEIARRLHVSRKTVEHHVAKVLAKLGLRSRAEAAAEAVRSGYRRESSAK